MASRLSLQQEFERILGSRNVYFSPPESIKLNYPCIIYKLDRFDINSADDSPYKMLSKYSVTLIHDDPDNTVKDELVKMRYSYMTNCNCIDGLNHYYYTIYQ